MRFRSFAVFSNRMRTKLLVLFVLVACLFLVFVGRIVTINRNDGDRYKRQVLLQQAYDSTTLPFKRGTITDSKGTVLASSTLVYNVVIDPYAILQDEAYLEPTIKAVSSIFGNDTGELSEYIKGHTDSRYYIVDKQVSGAAKTSFEDLVAQSTKEDGTTDIQGVFFEESYIRSYPNSTLASDVIGFAGSDNNGHYGLEEYYNDTLNGTAGRSYGYIDDTSDVEETTITATDGDNLVLTLDANIQSIVEKYIQEFNDKHKDETRSGNGARNTGCVVMDVNSGSVLAMAGYPNYDLNNPTDTSPLVGMTKLDFENNDQPVQDEYLTQTDVDALTDDQKSVYLNALWKNYCISDYYEPGSVAKPFTTAAGLEEGAFSPTQTFNCEGSLTVAEGTEPIKCHNTFGDGLLTVGEAIERSCNVCLMQEALAMGKDEFCEYQNIFGFGLKTNIDLANEAKTNTLIYTADDMGVTDLATNSFGQNFDVTMVQVISAFCSLINGGNYYQPHVVSKITSSSGATVKNIEPRVIKKTISEETSEWIRSYCEQVVSGENGTGKTARPAGYMIGGKTGTAETIPRDQGQNVVSFMGYAPADDPQIAIYVVVDRPNASPQDDAKYATEIVRNCLTEILPYLGIPMTEALSDDEKAELEELESSGTIALGASAMQALDNTSSSQSSADGSTNADGTATEDGTSSDGTTTDQSVTGDETGDSGDSASGKSEPVWKSFPLDEATGYLVDPDTGMYVDSVTGHEYSVGPSTTGTTTDGGDSGASADDTTVSQDTTATEQSADGTVTDAADENAAAQ